MSESEQPKEGGCSGCASKVVLALLALIGLGVGWGVLQQQREQARNNRVLQEQREEIEANTTKLLESKECSGCNLTKAQLSGTDLSGADLSGATLNQANLSGANLTGANLTGASLTSTNLTGANLTDAQLENIPMAVAAATVDEQTILPSGNAYVAREALAPACLDGSAFADAEPYQPGEGAPLMVAFDRADADAEFVLQDGALAGAWRASDAYSTELILCVDRSESELIETCDYDVNGTNYAVKRFRQYTSLTLVEASTGQIVDATTNSNDPVECSPTISVTQAQLDAGEQSSKGAAMSDQDIQAWVQTYAQP